MRPDLWMLMVWEYVIKDWGVRVRRQGGEGCSEAPSLNYFSYSSLKLTPLNSWLPSQAAPGCLTRTTGCYNGPNTRLSYSSAERKAYSERWSHGDRCRISTRYNQTAVALSKSQELQCGSSSEFYMFSGEGHCCLTYRGIPELKWHWNVFFSEPDTQKAFSWVMLSW